MSRDDSRAGSAHSDIEREDEDVQEMQVSVCDQFPGESCTGTRVASDRSIVEERDIADLVDLSFSSEHSLKVVDHVVVESDEGLLEIQETSEDARELDNDVQQMRHLMKHLSWMEMQRSVENTYTFTKF